MIFFVNVTKLFFGLSIERPYLAKAQKLISAEMHGMCSFHCEMHKTADFHSNLLVFWELVTESFQDRLMKCAHFKLKYIEMPSNAMQILCISSKYAHFTHFNEMHD